MHTATAYEDFSKNPSVFRLGADDRMPKFLHRFCGTHRALQVLRDRTLYLAPPKWLNDPFEFTGLVDFECPERDRKVILDLATRNELGLSDQQIRESEARRDKVAKTEFFVYLLSLRIRDILGYLREFSGVCCFTAHCEHPLFWSHYADAHRGVCLVVNNLDGRFPALESALPVIYTDAKPTLRLLDFYLNRETFREDLFQLLHTKQEQWSYEREWRVVHPSTRPLEGDERTLEFEEQHLCKIILGDRISAEGREAIRAQAQGRRFPLLIYQARVLDQKYSLAYKLLPDGVKYRSHRDWHKLPGDALPSPFPFVASSNRA